MSKINNCVKSVYNDFPILGSWKETESFSQECALKVIKKLATELTYGKAVVSIIEK